MSWLKDSNTKYNGDDSALSNQEAALVRIRDLSIPFLRQEDCIEVTQVFIRRELIEAFADLMELNERLENT